MAASSCFCVLRISSRSNSAHTVAILAHTPSTILGGDSHVLASTAIPSPVVKMMRDSVPCRLVLVLVEAFPMYGFEPLSLSSRPLRKI